MRLESEILCDLMHNYLTGEKIRPVPDGLDLKKMEDLLVSHGVATTLASSLTEAQLPLEFCRKFDRATSLAEENNTIMLLELTRFLEKLKNGGCSPVVLKGAGLVQTVYKSLGQRVFADLDILVPLGQVQNARVILEELGYTPAETLAPVEYYFQHHFHLIMKSPGGITVEIHWSLTPPNSNYQFDIERFASRARAVDTPNGQILMPSCTDQLLHCVFQNIADGFSGLRRIIDAALILPFIEDQEQLAKEAKEQNLGTGLWAVLRLVQELTKTPVSKDLMARLEPSRFVVKCFESLDLPQNCLEQRALNTELLNNWSDWLCLPSSKLVVREVWHYLLPRSEDYLYYGHQLETAPAWPRRIKVSLSHLFYLLGLTARLARDLPRKTKTLAKVTS